MPDSLLTAYPLCHNCLALRVAAEAHCYPLEAHPDADKSLSELGSNMNDATKLMLETMESYWPMVALLIFLGAAASLAAGKGRR